MFTRTLATRLFTPLRSMFKPSTVSLRMPLRRMLSTQATEQIPSLPLIDRLKTPYYIGRVHGWGDKRLLPYYLGAITMVSMPIIYKLYSSSAEVHTERAAFRQLISNDITSANKGLKDLCETNVSIHEYGILKGYVGQLVRLLYNGNTETQYLSAKLITKACQDNSSITRSISNEARKLGGFSALNRVVSFSPSLRARAQAVVCMDALVSYSLDNAVEFIETGSSEAIINLVKDKDVKPRIKSLAFHVLAKLPRRQGCLKPVLPVVPIAISTTKHSDENLRAAASNFLHAVAEVDDKVKESLIAEGLHVAASPICVIDDFEE
eukprot:TRINITY_DN2428_c0_g1_i1.p1 TRINITY_DN2428_c0_g1~~TRINITY_DN2428_c0_g1_i1.p1  ORF type:complete len:322 (-),score=84.85 TRINITY_DN2428_c0_g1_i1:59-1024(-)